MSTSSSIPITVVTGFLGAGKTTLILGLLPQLPADYKVVLLKNEFGDVEVDSKLAQESSLTAVSEILNGCMCCILVGQMQNACLEIRDKYKPDRIIIECSGSAFPATLAFQLRDLERETSGGLKLDAIVTVIDAQNFCGYEDTSPTARMQASYTDVILINKWELVSEYDLETVMDHLHTLNDTTPMLRCNGKQGVDPRLIFGIESQLFLHEGDGPSIDPAHNEEVQTVTLYRGPASHAPGHHSHKHDSEDHTSVAVHTPWTITATSLADSFIQLPKKGSIWRIKGFVRLDTGQYLLNWAFGRYELTFISKECPFDVKLTVMGERGEVKKEIRSFALSINTEIIT